MSIKDRIMYCCTACAKDSPESCGYFDRTMLRVLPDGSWLCDGCFDNMPLDERGGDKCWSDFPSPPEHLPSDDCFQADLDHPGSGPPVYGKQCPDPMGRP